MRRSRKLSVLVGGLAVGLAGAAYAAEPTTQQDLLDKINSLQAQVDALKAQAAAPTTAPAVANDQQIADATQRVLQEADSHNQFFDSTTGVTGGWNSDKMQFFVASTDGNFYFHPGIAFQERYVAGYRTAPDVWSDGFETRRMKFYFDGNVFTPDLTYKFQWQDSQTGGAPTLEYGWAQLIVMHDVGPGDVGIKVGQTKNYASKEQAIVGDTNQLMVERSLNDSVIGGNSMGGPLIEGVDFVYTGSKTPVHGDLMFNGGNGSGLSSFPDTTPAGLQNNFGAAVRGDYKVFGDWADNADLTGQQAKHDFLDIGAGADFTQGQTALPVGTPSSDAYRWDLDAQYTVAQKFVVYGAFQGDFVQANDPASVKLVRHHMLNTGELIQAGYFLNPAWELAARYDVANIDKHDKIGAQGLFQEVGFGVNWFLGDQGSWGNHAKITFDADYLPNGNPTASGLDYLASPSDHTAVVFRAQFQLWL